MIQVMGGDFVCVYDALNVSSLNIEINSRVIKKSSCSIWVQFNCSKLLKKQLCKAPAPLCGQCMSTDIRSYSRGHTEILLILLLTHSQRQT